MIDLDEAKRLGREAFEAPWGARGDMVTQPGSEEALRRMKENEYPFTSRRIAICENDTYLTPEQCAANAAFIAYARNHWDEVLNEIRELRAENQKLKDRVDDFISRDRPGFNPANKDTPALPIPDVFEGGLIDED